MKPFQRTIGLAAVSLLIAAASWIGIASKEVGARDKPEVKEVIAAEEPDPMPAKTIEEEQEELEEKREARIQQISRGSKGVELRPETDAKEPEEDSVEPQEPQIRLYDIPLSDDLQEYTFNLCQDYGIDYELTLALMEQESDYRAHLISGTNDYGIMQINKVNHEWLKKELGINDFLDPRQNIQAGTRMLADLFKKYEEPHKVLMAYNFGEGGARKHWNQGTYSSKYSRSVMTKLEKIKERRK